MSVKQTASVLYAYILAASATNSAELKTMCAQAPDQVENLNEELMNGIAFQAALCAITEPLSMQETLDVVITLMSKMFIIMLESASNTDGWLNWLCSHVDVEGVTAVGLYGEAVVETLCHDSLAVTSP